MKRLDETHASRERTRLLRYSVLHTIGCEDMLRLRLYRSVMCAALAAALASPPAPGAQALTGRVTQVIDGDTLDVMVEGKRLRVRLAGIDAPRGPQAYSVRSRQSLIAICGGEVAAIESAAKQRSGVMSARVGCNGVDAAREQVRRGMARVPERHATADPALQALETEARTASRGLWATAPR